MTRSAVSRQIGSHRARSALTASVVIPAYNHEDYILEAVDSALAEPVLEVVVVDDGSTDSTRDRLMTRRDEPRLVLRTQENRGAHNAIMRGIETARGDILLILNSDDAFLPGRVAACLAHFERDAPPALVASWLELIDGQGASLGTKQAWRNMPPWSPRGPGPGLAATGDPVLALLEANYIATTSNVAFPRRLAVGEGAIPFTPLRYAHDWDFLLGACAQPASGGLELIEEPFVRYRVHGSNTIREGKDASEGQGLMRFEVLWVILRHRHTILRAAAARGHDPIDLERRAEASLPPFATDALVAHLRALRGTSLQSPAVYDRLIEPGHPFRRAAIAALAAMADG